MGLVGPVTDLPIISDGDPWTRLREGLRPARGDWLQQIPRLSALRQAAVYPCGTGPMGPGGRLAQLHQGSRFIYSWMVEPRPLVPCPLSLVPCAPGKSASVGEMWAAQSPARETDGPCGDEQNQERDQHRPPRHERATFIQYSTLDTWYMYDVMWCRYGCT